MKIGGIYAAIEARLDQFERDLSRAERMMGSTADGMNREIGRITFAHVGIAAAAFTAAFAVGMKEAVSAASDLQETTSKFEVVFRDQKSQAEDMAKTLVGSFAMSTREAKQYLSSVQDLLVPMGMASEKAADMSGEVVKLAADLGSFNNLPTADVMADIQSALVGNFETMKKYGVVLNETVVKQKALEMGLYSGKGALDASVKAGVAFQLMLEGSAAAIGDMERTAGSYANQIKQLKANYEDIAAAIGERVLPQMTEFVTSLNNYLETNPQVVQQLGEFAENMIGLTRVLGSAVMGAVEFGNVWVKTWQALGLAAGGVIDLSTALTDGAAAVSRFNAGQAEILKLEKEIAAVERDKAFQQNSLFRKWTAEEEAHLQALKDERLALIAAQEEIENVKFGIEEIGTAWKNTGTSAKQSNDLQQKEIDETVKKLKEYEKAAADSRNEYRSAISDEIEAERLRWKAMEEGASAAVFGVEEVGTALKNAGDDVNDLGAAWDDMTVNFKNSVEGVLVGLFEGEIRNINQLFDELWQSIVRGFFDMVATLTVNSLFGMLPGNLIGANAPTWGSMLGGFGASAGGTAAGSALTGGAGGGFGAWLSGIFGGSAPAGGFIAPAFSATGATGATFTAGGTAGAGLGAGAVAAGGLAGAAGMFGFGLAGSSLFKDVETLPEALARVHDEILKLDDSLSITAQTLGIATRASYNAGENVLFMERGIDAWNGQINYSIAQYDRLTGTWSEADIKVADLLEQMEKYIVTSGASTDAAAQLIAEMAGFPSIADELAIAYGQMGQGAMSMAAQIQHAASIISQARAYPNFKPGISSEENTNYPTYGQSDLAAAQLVLDSDPTTRPLGGGKRPEASGLPRGAASQEVNVTMHLQIDGQTMRQLMDDHIVTRERRGVSGLVRY